MLNILQILKYTKFKILFVLLQVITHKTCHSPYHSDSQIIFMLQFNNCIEMIVKTSSSIFIIISEVAYSCNQY